MAVQPLMFAVAGILTHLPVASIRYGVLLLRSGQCGVHDRMAGIPAKHIRQSANTGAEILISSSITLTQWRTR